LVVPGDDGSPLYELLWRRSDRRAVRLQRGDDLGRAGDESGAVARHGRPLAQRLEDDRARPIDGLESRGRWLVEPELRVRLIRADEKIVTLGCLGERVVEFARRDGTGRVVRVIHPEERDVVVELREIRQEPVLAPQWQRLHPGAGEERAALVH